MKVNNNFSLLGESYLFAEVGRKVREYAKQHPDADIIRMDIGDVTLPIANAVVTAMKKAVEEMGNRTTFHGYGPEQGYSFLREKIALEDYEKRGVEINPDEIFISDGAKCDVANLTDIFGKDTVAAIPNPVYPVYMDSNIIAGRTVGNGKIRYLECKPENRFKPSVPDFHADIIYLCSPNNPTGTVLDKEDLKEWVEYAKENKSIIIFDSAYESYITDPELPKSIYEINGAKEVAIEVRSYSKTAGFTGLRCGYTVVPEVLIGNYANNDPIEIRKLWLRRQTTKFNGASYIIQRGAEAIYSPEGKNEVKANINYYLRNSRLLYRSLKEAGFDVIGGENSPYVWFKSADGSTSWEMFDILLNRCNLSSTPGSGFGDCGEGCLRLTGFNTYENTLKAVERLKSVDFKV